jgi:glycosyltransferase involved in cell wall biosynthesis
MMNEQPAPFFVFADDWGRHPSSAQHLFRRLLPQRSVTWVNTIGTRPPRLDLATVRRGFEKLRHWARPREPQAITDGPRVVAPKMWPWISSNCDRWLNRWLLERQLRPLIESMPTPPIIVTAIPVVADLVGRLPAARWVYYCVDDFSEWPGLDGAALRRLECHLLERVDTVVAVSDNLIARLAGLGRSATLLTHGVDLDDWSPERVASGHGLTLNGLSRPRIVFWGVIDRRMDVDVIERLSTEIPEATVVLVGPQDDPDPALWRRGNVIAHPPVPFAELPALAADADLLVMPYADLPVTRAMQPLKLKEYLATGRPAVVRDLPATRPWADCCDLADTPASFVERVRERLATGTPAEQAQRRRQRLADESWQAKATTFAALCDQPEVAHA